MEQIAENSSQIKSRALGGKILGGLFLVFKKIAGSVLGAVGSLFVFFLLFSLLGAGLGGGLGGSAKKITEKVLYGEGEAKVAVIPLSGLILEEGSEAGMFGVSRNITPSLVRDFLKKAAEDKDTAAVVLSINSPGGSAVASDEIYEEIVSFEKSGKPVVVLMGDVAASGGYYIASAADYLAANPNSLTGSIGVIAEIYNMEELYKKIGVREEVYKKGIYKDLFSSSRERTTEEKKMIQELLDETYETFLERVAKGRNMPVEKLRNLAEGRIYSGTGAKKAGLIDEVMTFRQAGEKAASLANVKQFKVVEYQAGGIWDSLFGGVSLALDRIFSLSTRYPRMSYL